jgi:alpha-tubulin suppressor-like RCC1 family protein
MRTRAVTLLALALCRCGSAVVQAPRRAPTVVAHASAPTTIAAPRDVSLGAGDNFVCGLKSDATVWRWGGNDLGQLAQARDVRHSVVPVEVVAARGATQLAVHDVRACVRTSDGRVLCWGAPYRHAPNEAQLDTHVPWEVRGIHDAAQVATGGPLVCAVTREHRLQCVGVPRLDRTFCAIDRREPAR